jgi:hypothetical protein
MPRAPRLQLTAEFRAAILNDPRGIVRLATVAGFGGGYPNFSVLIRAPRFRGTALVCSRLRQLAADMQFTGDLWHQ